jgi:5-methylcytosine-specific restriction endonuclease McrA
MRFADIKRHLLPYAIYQRRKTTINHAFAASIAPSDVFDAETVKHAIRLLGQNPDEELLCVYCDEPAETWDHVFATVRQSVFSGAGHRVGNLLPCCKPCNSKKGNREWKNYICTREAAGPLREKRIHVIARYLEEFFVIDSVPTDLPEYDRLLELRAEILGLMKEADSVATAIRGKMKAKHVPPGSL